MKRINLNGVKLTIYCAEELLNAGAMIDSRYKDIGDDLYLFGLDTKGDYVKASGMEQRGEVDYALDEKYLSTLSWQKRKEIISWCVSFYYHGKGIGYDIVDIRDLLPEIKKQALKEYKNG